SMSHAGPRAPARPRSNVQQSGGRGKAAPAAGDRDPAGRERLRTPRNAALMTTLRLIEITIMKIRLRLATVLASACFASLPAAAQIGVPPRPLPDGPFVIDTAEQGQVRVTVMRGLELPWDLAFLP